MKTLAFTFLAIFGIALNAHAQNLVIYDDALENGWQNYGWATINYANTSPVYSGADSISVIDPGSPSPRAASPIGDAHAAGVRGSARAFGGAPIPTF